MPVSAALASAVYGFFYGLWPIAWIIVAAVFLYKLSVKTGQFDVIRSSILSVTHDQRLQLILVGFCFGAFLEGAAGFGAPVAITAALLVGLGFKPLYAAGLCLIANTAPVAFGAMGIPVIVAGQVSGIDPFLIGQMAGRQLPFMTILVLFWIMAIMDGWRGVKETWPAVLVGGGSFAVVQFLTANYIGPELPDITSAIVSLIALTAFLKVWQPKRIFRFDTSDSTATSTCQARGRSTAPLTAGAIVKAWSPFIILTAMVTPVEPQALQSTVRCRRPAGLDHHQHPRAHARQAGCQMPPVVAQATPYGAVYTFNWLAATGTAILDRRRPGPSPSPASPRQGRGHAGRDGARAGHPHLLHRHGAGLCLRGQLLGPVGHAGPGAGPHGPRRSRSSRPSWAGSACSSRGSDTSANALFGALQATTANQLGLSPVLTVAANTTGGVTGKMISPSPSPLPARLWAWRARNRDLFRFTVKHSLGGGGGGGGVFAAIIGIICTLQAYVFTWMIPGH